MTSTETERRTARLAAAFAVSDAHTQDKSERKEKADRQAREAVSKRDAERELADADDDLYENMPI